MTPVQHRRSISRRAALGGLGASGLSVAFAHANRSAGAQATPAAMATHPAVGTWLSGTGPNDLGLVHWDADGNMDFQVGTAPTTGSDGAITYNDTRMGVWEPVDE